MWRLCHSLAVSCNRLLAPSRERKGSSVNKSLLLVDTLSKDNYRELAGVLVGGRGESSVCLIYMKYMIIILIIIIKRLGEILLSYIANTSRTHVRTHALTQC